MAKKQNFAALLGGIEQPASVNNVPESYVPFDGGEEFNKKEAFRYLNGDFGSPFESKESLPFSGKFYKGSASDPSQRTIQGENQPWTSKLFNGVLGHTASVATKFGTGAAELGGGVFDLVSNIIPGVANQRKEKTGSYFPHLFENFLTKGFSYVENDLIEQKLLPIYGGQDYYSDSVFKQMGDMKFWSSDMADAVAFTVAAYMPVAGFTKAAKAMGMAVKGAKGGLELSNKGKLFTTLATTIWNTGQEAGLEAKQGLDTMREDLAQKYHDTSYDLLTVEQKQAINHDAAPYAANIFKTNVAVLAGPNLIQSRFFIGPVATASKKLSKAVKAGTIEAKDISILKKALLSGGTGVLSEGAWEEGMQNAVQNYEQHKANGTSFLDRAPGYAYEWLSGWNSTEGQKSMLMGALVGLGMGARSGVKDALGEKKYVTEFKTKYDKEIKQNFPLYDNELATDIKHPYKTFQKESVDKDGKKTTVISLLNDKGETEFDMDKIIKMYNADMSDKAVLDNLMMSALNMDPIHEKFVLNQALEQLFYKYVSNPIFDSSDEAFETLLTRNPLKQLAEDEELKKAGFDYDYMLDKLNQIKKEWDGIEKNLQHKEDLEADNDTLSFKKLIEKGYLYQTMKLRWLDEVDQLVSDKTQVDKLREDANNSIELFKSKKERDVLFKKWIGERENKKNLDEQIQNEERKDPNSAETKKYKYLKRERETIYGKDPVTNEFTITQSPKEKTGESGLLNQHFINIGADAMTGARLESEMNKVKEGRSSLSNVVDILYNPSEGSIETRGKYDVTQNDIDEVKKLIPIATKQVNDLEYTEQLLKEDSNIILDRLQNGEFEVGVTEEELVKPFQEKFKESEIRKKDLEDAIGRLNALQANEEGKGLLNYKKNFSKLEKSNDIFERQVADQPVEEANSISSIVSNSESYSALGRVKKAIQELKDHRDIYENTDLKSRLEKKVFKGYIESLNKAIDNLEKKILPTVEKNYNEKKDIDKANQKSRNKRRFIGLGITIGDDNKLTVTDQEIYNKVEDIVGKTELSKILKEAEAAVEVSDEFGFHEVFVDKIISLIRKSKKADQFANLISKRYDAKTKEFREYYNSLSNISSAIKTQDNIITKYILNPAKLFKDVISNVAGIRETNPKKNAIDKYKSNNDVLELKDNLSIENTTGYGGISKEQLTGLVTRHIEIESLFDISEYLESEFNLEDELKIEKEIFIENKLAPTNQQLSAIRQIARWWMRPLTKITNANKELHRFKNWLFVKGSAGTGKSTVVINFFMKTLGIKPNEVQMLAPSANALSVLKEKTIATTEPILIKNLSRIDESIKLVVIDEIAAINNPDLIVLVNKLQEINEKREKPFRVIVLGDPNQVSAQENTTITTTDPEINTQHFVGIEYMHVVDPLTIKHRSIIPEINELLDVYEDNYNDVSDITVNASNDKGQKSIGVHAGDMAGLMNMLQVHKDNGRSKVIVVATDNERKKLQTNPDIAYLKDNIFTYTEVAGTEFDEVYTLLSKDQFKDVIEFNKGFYTAISRAKQYIYILDKNNAFKNQTKAEMNSAFGEKGSYIVENEKINKERKTKYQERLRVEEEVMKGTKPTKTVAEVEKEVAKESEEIIDNIGNRSVDEIIEDVETPDDNGQGEEDSDLNAQRIEVVTVGNDDTVHNLKYPTYVGTRYMNVEEGSMTGKLIPGGDVIYIKAEDPTGKDVKGYTIHVLGQLYDIENKPLPNRYAHLGIVGTDELNNQFGIDLEAKAQAARDNDGPLYNTVTTKNGISTIKNIPGTILTHGSIAKVTPLTYKYSKDNKPTKSGKGLFNYIYDLISNKYFSRKPEESNPEYSVHIFSQKELARDEYAELRDKNLKPGVPYLLMTSRRKDNRYRKTQFIRLNPVNLSKNDGNIVKIGRLYDAVAKIEEVLGGSSRLGDRLFNEMIDAFSVNYYLNGDKVEFKEYSLTYQEYKRKASDGYVADLTKAQFNKVQKLITPVVIGLYGKGQRRERIGSEAEMITKYKLTKNEKENVLEDDDSVYEFKPSTRSNRKYGHVLRYNKADKKDKGEYIYEDALMPGSGEAQIAFNVLAKANETVNGEPIRVSSLTRYHTTGIAPKGRTVITGKSILNTNENNTGYYAHLRKALQDAGEKVIEQIWNKDDTLTTKIDSWFVTEDNVEEAEKKILELGLMTQESMDKLKNDHTNKPVTSDLLKNIVHPDNFKKGKHTSLRTPLIMEQINKWGNFTPAVDNDVESNKAKLEEVLQTNIEDIIPTNVSIKTNNNTVEEKPNPIEDNKKPVINEDPDLPNKLKRKPKALADTGPVYLGKKVSQIKAKWIIRKSIPGITDRDIRFVEKNVVNDMALEIGVDKAWGLYKDGILYLAKNEDGTVWDNIARHEVFHKIYNEYFTAEERSKIDELARKEFKDHNKYTDIEELLAVKYHSWKRGLLDNISDFFKALFIRIQRLLNLQEANIESIDDYFFRVKYGLFNYRTNKGENITRLMQDIRTKFGSIDNYVLSAEWVIKKFRRTRLEGIAGIGATHEEIRQNIKDLVKELSISKLQDYNRTHNEEDKRQYEFYNAINTNFNNLVKDVFPGFNNYKGGIYQSKLDTDIKAEMLKEKTTVNNNKHIAENEKTNTELDITDEVKELLSYIQDENGDLLSWRYVYVKMIDMFEGLSFDQGNVVEQIRESFKSKDLTKNEEAILDFVTDLYNSFNSNLTSKGNKYNNRYKYLKSDLFIYSKDKDGSVVNIKHENDKDVRDGSVVILRKNAKETSVEFARRIIEETGITQRELSDQSLRLYNAQMWQRLTSHFNSHRQRDPKIGERYISYGSFEIRYINARGSAVANGIKDRLAYKIGEKLKTEEDIKEIINKAKEWREKHKTSPIGFVKEFLYYVNLPQYAGSLTNHLAAIIQQDIENVFPKILGLGLLDKELSKEDTEKIEQDAQRNDEQSEDDVAVYTTEWIIEKYFNSFLNHLTESVNLLDNLSRILSSNDANNQRRYNAILSSQAHKNLFNLIHTKFSSKRTGLNELKVNDTFNKPFFKNNIFINGLNRIYRVIDDDGLKYDNQVGDTYALEYKNEKREDFNFRTFVLGFLTSTMNSGEKENRYIQYIYPNERKTPFGVEIRVLDREKALQSIESTIRQIKERKIESFLGFEVLREVLGNKELSKVKDIKGLALKVYNRLDEKSHQLTENIIYDRTAFDSTLPFSRKDKRGNTSLVHEKLNNIVDKELYPGFSIGNMPKNRSGHLKLQETTDEFVRRTGLDTQTAYDQGEEKEYLIKPEHIQPLVSAYFINNYINSYHFTQVVAGDQASFADAELLIRRLSIAFAPGKTGFVNSKFGMNRYSRVAVIDDPIKDVDSIATFMKSLMPDLEQAKMDELMKLFPKKGFKPGDAQGFILPERLDDINLGFGEDFGNVIKGVYYHIEDDGTARAIKYSSIVLSDELCAKYGALAVLRNKMRDNVVDGISGVIDEVVFNTAVKVGNPAELNNWNEIVDLNSNIGFKIDSQFLIDNKDYRIQLDPEADLESEVSYPTQLSYLMKLYGTNDELALRIYNSLSNIIRGNFSSLESWMGKKSFKEIIENFLEKSSQENLRELLSDGIDPNFPAITDKLLVHFLSTIYDRAVHTKFEGTKLVLQTALGAKKTFESKNVSIPDNLKRDLQIVIDANGRMHYECIVPRGFISKDIEERIQTALDKNTEPDDMFFMNFKSKDLLGFRIPSSEMHSAVPIKIVGFYDSKGTNVIIAPDMLTVIHGSDFDIDSLFTIHRSYVLENNKLAPTGYIYDSKDKVYKFNNDPSFIDQIGDAKIRRKVNEAYYLNKILEDFLDATSAPGNVMRMLSPIYLGELQEEKTRIKELTKEEEKPFDPSNAIDAQEIHNTIFTGEGGIGMFMSMFKAFSFMHLAENEHEGITRLKGTIKPNMEKLAPEDKEEVRKNNKIKSLAGDYTKLAELENLTDKRKKKLDSLIKEINDIQDIKLTKEDYKGNIELVENIYDKADESNANIYTSKSIVGIEGKHIIFNGDAYDSMVDKTESGKESGYRFDSLGNAALDNFKEMILPYLNAGRETIRAYSVLVMHGVEFRTINNFITQPILRYFTKYGYKDAGYLQRKVAAHLNKDATYGVGLTDSKMEEYLKYTPEDIKRILDKEKLSDEEMDFLVFQQVVYDQYKTLRTIGDDISKVVRVTNAIRSFPVSLAEMEDILTTAKSIMGIPQDKSIMTTPNDDNSTFPYYMKEFFTTNPHVLEALRVMEWAVNKVNAEFIIYNNTIRKVSDKILSDATVKLDRNDDVNRKKIRDEFVRFIMTSQVNRENIKPKSVLGRKGKEIILTGVNAFNKRFVDMVLDAQSKDHMRVMKSKNDPNDLVKYQGNIFLNSLSVKRDVFTGREKIIFNGPSSMDSKDYNLYKQSFEQLNFFDYDDINGKVIQHENPQENEYTKFQKLFVDYAILNYGMSFGLRNYSKVLPGTIYKDVSNRLIVQMNDILKLDKDALNNLTNAFEAQLILNYPEGLYRSSVRIANGVTKNSKEEVDPVTKKKITVNNGVVNGTYYDRWFEAKGERKWPKWHIEKFDDKITVFRRISAEEGLSGFYVRVGHKNTEPIYDLRSVEDGIKYNENDRIKPEKDKTSLRVVKGVVQNGGFYKNRYDDLTVGQVVMISDFSDPGNMYGQEYIIDQKISDELYRVKELKGFKGRAYLGQEGSSVRKAYALLKKQLVSKGTPFRSLSDRIFIKKYQYPEGVAYWQNVNNKQFNGLQVLSQTQTALGMEVRIDEQKLADWVYGQQLDMFGRAYKGDKVYNKKEVIDMVLANYSGEARDILQKELTTIDKDEFNKVVKQAGFNSLGTHWVLSPINNIDDYIEHKIINEVTVSKEWEDLTDQIFVIDNKSDDRLKELSDLYNNKTAEQILDDIENRATSKFHKLLLSWLRPLIKEVAPNYIGHENLPKGLGFTKPTGEISIDLVKLNARNASLKDIDRIILHEFIHSITTIQMAKDPKMVAQIRTWMNHIASTNPSFVEKHKQAFIDEYEFVSEILTKESLFDDLDKIIMPSNKKTILDQFIDWLLSLIGAIRNVSYAMYMKNWLKDNIKPLPLLKQNEKGEYTDQNGRPVTLEDFGWAYSNIDDTKFLKKIIDDGIDVTNPLDDDGNETDYYLDSENTKFGRISDIYNGFVGLFRKAGKHETFGEREANQAWFNTEHDVVKKLEGIDYTYDQYKIAMDKKAIESSVRGKIVHLMNKLINDRIYNGGRNEGRIKLEIQSVAYKDYKITDSKGNKYEVSITMDPEDFNWYTEKIKDIYRTHNINSLEEEIPKDLKDMIASEVTIASKELGFAGTADMIIEHSDGTISIKDMASGRNFDKYISSRLLRYGEQNKQIHDSPRDRKKLQIMMYAFMIKLKNPDVKFRDLSIMWVPDRYTATSYDHARKVEVDDYLNMIKTYLKDKKALKEDGLNENLYDEVVKKSPKIFETSEYTYEFKENLEGLKGYEKNVQDKLISEVKDNDDSSAKMAEKAIIDLTRLIGQAPVITKLGKNKYEELDKADQIKARRLTDRILQLIKDPDVALHVNPELDISVITSWIGNYSDLSVPQIQMWKKFRDQQEEKAYKEFEKKDYIQKSLLRPVIDEYYKANPLLIRNKRYLNFNNYKKMFNWMYKEFDNNGATELRYITNREEDKVEYDKLTEAQKNYLNFLNDHYKSYFEGADAYLKQVSTYVPGYGGEMRSISHIDLFNRELKDQEKVKYYPGWFPKPAKEQSEMIYEAGEGSYMKGLLDPTFIKEMWIRSLTYYMENKYEGRTHAAMVLPLKYMGSLRINTNREYTYNPELQFDQFTKSIEYKKYMDPVYALGEGVRMFLDQQKDKDQPLYHNSSMMFEKKLTSDILGRTIRPQLTKKALKLPIGLFSKYDDRELRSDALLMLLKNWTSATLMWLKPFTGGGNGVNAMLLQHKDGIRGSIGSLKLFGIEGDAIDTTLADNLFADKVYFTEHIANSITGNFEKDKTWLLLKKLRYLPDQFDYMSSERYLLSIRNRIVSESSMYAFHRVPEEAVSMITMISQLHHLKNQKTGKSLWDSYEVQKMPNGEYDVVWTGGTRGKIKEGSGNNVTYTDLNELTSQEIAKLKKVYERLQGGYRKEEAAAIEVYVLGKIFMQLKKYYPRLLLNAFASRRNELDMGYLKKTADRKDGEDVYQWMQRVNEGRFRVLGKFFLSTVMMGAGNRDYKWHNMPDSLKLHVIDAGVTLGMWFTAYIGYLKMFGDDKDNDTMKQWWKMYLMDNFIQQYSPKELMKIGVQSMQPVAFSRALQTVTAGSTMLGATWDYAFGDKAEAFTDKGDFKGWIQLRKSIPFAASYFDIVRRIENSEDLSKIMQFEQFSKWR